MKTLVKIITIMPVVGFIMFAVVACTDWNLPVDLGTQPAVERLAAEQQTKTRLENFKVEWSATLNELNQAKKSGVNNDSLNIIRTKLDSMVVEYGKIKEELKSYR